MARPKKELPNRPDNLFEVKAVVGVKMDGKPIRKSFYSSVSKTDAQTKAGQYKIEQQIALQTGEAFLPKNVAFANWARRWLAVYKKNDIDDNTYRLTYVNTIENHLIPYFGAILLTNIKPVNIKDFYITKSKMSSSMLSKMKMCLNAIFDTAIDNDLCYKNPAKNVDFVSSKEPNKKKVYTDEQMKIVTKCAIELGCLEVAVILNTGIRRGELAGLQKNDVIFEDMPQYSVHRSIADRKGGGVAINPPKWNSHRTNPLDPVVVNILKNIRNDSIYFFPTDKGEPQSPNTLGQKISRFMNRLNEAHPNVPKLTAHELRHTYGTHLRRRGVDIYSIQKIMGHKDIKMTTEIYVHNEIEVLQQAVKTAKI